MTNEEIGIAAIIPGVQMAIDQLIQYKESLLARLDQLRSGPSHKRTPRGKQVPPPENIQKANAAHPRNPDHPDHAKWVAKMRRLTKARWANMTPQERKDRIAAMTKHRRVA